MGDSGSTSNNAAIRKRAQIAKANRTMFLWIAISSALVGSAIVVSYFLGQKMIYNEKVLAEMGRTVSTLKANNDIAPELQAQIRILDTNENLNSAKANPDDQALQVILDALPDDANSLALGASFQSRLLTGVDGVVIESLQVEPVVGIESQTESAAPVVMTETEGETVSQHMINIQFAVSGSQDALQTVLRNLERSIRLIDIRLLQVESRGETQMMTIQARAYYEPAKTIELQEKVVEP
ncbi:hypothetical protein B7Y94_00280 [Candidatus Saccharibacteria bacterium 32-49-12]|nr:MAG: hypothetical protein B7Y94_00280 [Candidatus Saccharibacteria bacterium 32-49-12]